MENVPGTTIKYEENSSVFERFSPFFNAADGLSLGQICSITGLEPFVVQNWVKRGFVPHPVQKKYGRRHLARILLITCLRDSMQIERIGAILSYVNGDTDDENDDIITDDKLFDAFCSSLHDFSGDSESGGDPSAGISRTLDRMGISDPVILDKLRKALSALIYGYVSGTYKRMSDKAFESMSGDPPEHAK